MHPLGYSWRFVCVNVGTDVPLFTVRLEFRSFSTVGTRWYVQQVVLAVN